MKSYTVGVVVPTVGRESIVSAVESVLRQTVPVDKIVVVFDGSPDDPSADYVTSLDRGVTVIYTGQKTNGNYARNAGVRELQTELVAFLDDDDRWHPNKIAKQIEKSPQELGNWLTTTAVHAAGEIGDDLPVKWPARGPYPGEDIGDYFFVRAGIRQTPRFIQTSTWLGPRRLFLEHPFDEDRKIHQDWDWLIRASAHHAVEIRHVDAALVDYTRNTQNSTSSQKRFDQSRAWILEPDLPISEKARGDFIMHMLLTRALREGELMKAMSLPWTAFHFGKPSFWGVLGGCLRLGRHLLTNLVSKRC